jgi:RND superfamily putative drug exporter
LNRSFDQIQEIPDSFDSVQGYQVLQEHYDIGEMEPVQIVIVAPDDINLIAPQSLSALSKIANDLKNLDGVLNVKSIVNPRVRPRIPPR